MPTTSSHFLILIALTGLLVACAGSKIQYDYYTKARFSEYDTFSWMESSGEGTVLIAPLDQHIRQSVTQALDSTGLSPAESGGDLLVTYHIGEKMPIFPSRHGYTYWPGHWSYGGYYRGIEQYFYPKGALIIDLIDRRSSNLVWRGSAPKVIRNADTEKLQTAIDEAVREIMENFPPNYGR